MAGSFDKDDRSIIEVYLDVISGPVDDDTRKLVARELEDPDSDLNMFLGGLDRNLVSLLGTSLRRKKSTSVHSNDPDVSADKRGRGRLVTGLAALAVALLLTILGGRWLFPSSESVAYLDDGFGRITKNQSGEISGLDAYPTQWRDEIASMIENERVALPLERLQDFRNTRGVSDASMYIEPVGTFVRSQTPTFQWKMREDVQEYEVRIESLDDPSLDIEGSGLIEQTDWTSTTPLPRGQLYSWSVSVYRERQRFASDESSPQFRVLSDDELESLTEEEAKVGNSRLVRAALYLEYGLLVDAQRELEALLEKNPESTVAIALLNSMRGSP